MANFWEQDEVVVAATTAAPPPDATVTQEDWWKGDAVADEGGDFWAQDQVVEPAVPVPAEPAGQSVAGTLGQSFVRGLADVVPSVVGGAAKLLDRGAQVVADATGTKRGGVFESIADFTDEIQAESARVYPVDSERNPIAATVGSGASQGLSLLAGGAAGKVLGVANAATVPVAAGFAMGGGAGIDEAQRLGVDSPEAQLAMGLLFGGVEMATERLGGIGNKAATDALMNAYRQPAADLLKRAAKSITVEGGEEMAAGTAQDLLARAFATEDPANPGFTRTGVKLPTLDKEFLKQRGLDFTGGAAGGTVFAGVDVAMNRQRPVRPAGGPAPMPSEINPAEVAPGAASSGTMPPNAAEGGTPGNPFAGPIQAPPQPTEAGGVVEPERSPWAPPPVPFEEAPPGLDAPRQPWVPPLAIDSGLNEAGEVDAEADVVDGLPRAMQPDLQPWRNDPVVEDAETAPPPSPEMATESRAGAGGVPDAAAGDPGGQPAEVDLFGNPVVDAPPATSYLDRVETVEVPLADLSLSQDVPQFKSDADERTGVVEPLAGSYQRLGTGPILVWERANGRREVISGRHRFDLARRTGEVTIPAQVVREADGFTREMAVMADAELNIRDGQGKVKDYANYFRNAGIDESEAESRGLRARAAGRAGWTIGTQGSQAVFDLHANGRLSDAAAEAVARTAPGNEALQRVGAQSVLDGQPIDVSVNLMRVMQSEFGGAGTAEQMDLFGADDSAMQSMREQAKRAALIQRNLREQVAAVQGAAKRPEKAAAMGVDVKDPAAVQARVLELKQELERWESWPLHEDLRAQVRGQLAPGQAFVQADPDGALNVTVPQVDDFQLQPATAEELEAEAQKRQQAAAIEARRSRPLQGDAGEFGTPDMLDTTAGPMALFGQPVRIRDDLPEAQPILQEIDQLLGEAKRRWDLMAEGQTKILTNPTDLLNEAEKQRLHQLQNRLRPKSAEEARADVMRRRKQRSQQQPVEALSAKFAVPAARGPLTTLHYAQLPPTQAGPVWSGKVRTLHGIRAKLLAAAGLPQVGIGRFSRALGIYRAKPETIRLQAINDIPVLAHELGHAVHYRELSANRTKADDWGGRYDAELMPLGQPTSTPTYTPDMVRKEGVAEFTRLWLTDPAKARAEAPNFAAFWEAELDRRNPKLAAGLRAARDEIADYIAMPAFHKAKAQIVFDPASERQPRTMGQRLRDTYAKWVNTLQPALNVVREAAKVDPTQAVRAQEVEAWMENHRGGWASKAHADIFGQQTSLDGKRLGPGMAQILKEIGPGQAEAFSTYLALKRAAEIERQGKRSGFENARLPAAEMQALEARFERTRQKLLKWSDNELQLLVDGGLLDAPSAAKMRQMNQDYVPFYRLYEKLNGVSFGPEASKNSGGYVDLNSGIRRLKGSDRAIVDPLQSLMKNAFMFRKIAEQNHIGVQFFDLLSDVQGHGKWTEQVRPKSKQTVIRHEQIVQKLIDEGVIQSEADLPQDADLTLRLYEAIKRPDTAKGEVIVFKNGQRRHWEVKDPLLMEALKNSDGDSIKLWKFLGGTLGKALTLPTRVVRFGATGGPWFALPNFIRDQVIAGVQSRTGFIPFVDGLRGAFEVMRKGDMYQRWMEAGGKFHGLTTGTQAFTDLLDDALPKSSSARRQMMALANPRNWKRALGYAGEVLEEATRVQEFARGVRQGLPDMQAANLSKAVSLNFARAGERGRALNMLIAFTNAKIQDLDLIVRSHADPARRGQVMLKGFMLITVPSLLTWWLGKDDEEIQNLPDWRKNLFWNINLGPVARPLGRESFILSIPKPFLMGAIYGTSVERALDQATSRDPNGARKAFKNLFAQGPEGLNPVEMVMSFAGLKPLIEATTNYNLWQDRPVVPEQMRFLPKPQQYDLHTSELAKMVGRFTGQSPMVIDHLVRGYFATAGKFGTDAIDYGMAKLGAADVPPAPAKDVMEAPILNRFSGSPYAANAFVDRFYKAARDMEGKLSVWNKQAEQMIEPDQARFWEKNGAELRHYLRTVNFETQLTGAGQVRKAMAALSDLNKAMKEVQASRVLSPEEKRSRLMRLSTQRNEVAENAFQRLFPEPVRRRHY